MDDDDSGCRRVRCRAASHALVRTRVRPHTSGCPFTRPVHSTRSRGFDRCLRRRTSISTGHSGPRSSRCWQLVLSQVPPVHVLILPKRLDIEVWSRAQVFHFLGNPNVGLYIILTNSGGRTLKVKSMTLQVIARRRPARSNCRARVSTRPRRRRRRRCSCRSRSSPASNGRTASISTRSSTAISRESARQHLVGDRRRSPREVAATLHDGSERRRHRGAGTRGAGRRDVQPVVHLGTGRVRVGAADRRAARIGVVHAQVPVHAVRLRHDASCASRPTAIRTAPRISRRPASACRSRIPRSPPSGNADPSGPTGPPAPGSRPYRAIASSALVPSSRPRRSIVAMTAQARPWSRNVRAARPAAGPCRRLRPARPSARSRVRRRTRPRSNVAAGPLTGSLREDRCRETIVSIGRPSSIVAAMRPPRDEL